MAYKNFFKAKQLRPSNNLREYLGLIGVPRGEMLFSFPGDRKSTRLNSSHDQISYAVFCLKKKKKKPTAMRPTMHSNSQDYRIVVVSTAQSRLCSPTPPCNVSAIIVASPVESLTPARVRGPL